MKRIEQKVEDTWCLEDMFESDDFWEEEFGRLQRMIFQYEDFEGTLGESADSLLEYLKFNDETNLLMERLYVYANMRYHQDMANSMYQEFAARAQKLMVEISGASAFAEPEILEITTEKINIFFNENPELETYKRYISEILRGKNHTLDKKTETILAKSRQMANAAENIFSMYNGADIKFPSITTEEGEEIEITHGNFVPLLESVDREVRKAAFEGVYETYGKMRNTLAATFAANLDQANFYAQVRNFSSAREMYLYGSNIPESVYDNLIETVHKNMDKMHKYVSLRKKILDVSELHMYDLYTPIAKAPDTKYSFEAAKDIVLEGLAPMGEEYIKVLEEGFDNRWIDVYENEGKRSGAYSWGAYGTHPYVLMNYHGTLDHVFTLAHEMGHAIHSYYSDANQPYVNAGYKIFVAEVASTCNESLLIQHLLKITEDEEEKTYLINHFLEQFKGTLYRQTMFAEFEKIAHSMVQNGEGVTADRLCGIYYNLNKEYFGDDIVIDKEIELEWARIPHFYNPFYVYQYATGLSAAIALSKRILEEGKPAVEDYMKFLTGGSSQDPIELLKIAGVDMTSSEPIETALELFGNLLEELQKITN
ncbi:MULTISPECIES: oligoendopeptidase F [unclassified Eubacterium (in: firmicutes)]|jgi:oligoendopeptidase F|uniref:oligoendopeptidase F n=1 Tax=unclassified Eubacterium (in: firmicutes) TaxID=2624479 RepID=UPI000E473836|nr:MULTISPECIES: oligoendopeptidase F [unclassified Eubacterium (in: firmicutes)]RGG65441.1 oligoendopeptidase F [Eubacterium sp. AF17-7]RHR35681.1 oligoendopeptidase F [Eubacterium sp. AF19-12LB]